MAWLELSLIVTAAQQAEVEAALDDLGALAVTLLDAEDHPIFEPAPGETPLWPAIALSALFEPDRDRAGLVHVLTDLAPDLSPGQIAFRTIEDQDWTRVWMDQFQPMRFGRRLWIYPWNIEPPAGDARRDHRAARSGSRVRHRHASDDGALPRMARRAAISPAARSSTTAAARACSRLRR